jgi:hypothetical protein
MPALQEAAQQAVDAFVAAAVASPAAINIETAKQRAINHQTSGTSGGLNGGAGNVQALANTALALCVATESTSSPLDFNVAVQRSQNAIATGTDGN